MCGGLKKASPHWPIGSGTSKRCGLLEVGKTLFEEVY